MSRRLRVLRLSLLCAVLASPGAGTALAQSTPSKPAPSTPNTAPKPPAPTGAPAPAATPPALKDPVVAIVNGQPIKLSELEVAQQALPPQYRNVPLQSVYAALLDRIIDSKLVVADGRKNRVVDDPAFKKRMAFVEEQVIQDFWLQREIARKVTAERLQQRYEERLKSMPPEEEVHARHILVSTEDEAKALIAELKKGVAFDKLAREKSTDKASGAEGGDLGWFKRSDMVKEFADAAFTLRKGELSETPVKTQFGYHVILLEDRRRAPPPSFEELSEQLREELARETVTGLLDQLRANAKIEKFKMDGSKQDAAEKPGGAAAVPSAPAGGAANPPK